MVTTTSSATRRLTADPAGVVAVREAWTTIDVDGPRTLIYGPRFGRLYLLRPAQARDRVFMRAVGLNPDTHVIDLPDPVDSISFGSCTLDDGRGLPAPRGARTAYRMFAASRQIVSFRMVAARLPAMARLFRRHMPPGANITEIGRMVAAAERGVEGGDCYPRALATALFCLAAGRACTLAIGVLSPTRKMHAWCGVDRFLPYEPMPEYYLYQPVWTARLQP